MFSGAVTLRGAQHAPIPETAGDIPLLYRYLDPPETDYLAAGERVSDARRTVVACVDVTRSTRAPTS
jgi:hypothetical protein